MKKCMLIVLALLVIIAISSSAYAEQTGNGSWQYLNSPVLNHNHSYIDLNDQTSKYKPPMEMLGDITFWKDEIIGIPYAFSCGGGYDLHNSTWGANAKVSIDISGQLRGLIGLK